MRRHRMTLALAAASALAVAGGMAVAVARGQAEPPGCDDIRAYQERYGEIETLGGGEHEVTVLGDSYSAGDSLSDRGRRWTDQIVMLEPTLTVELDAIAFTGYANRGACGPHSFRDRIDRAVSGTDETLIVQGGLNDVFARPETLSRAVDDVLDAAREVPRVIVVGPVDAPGRSDERRVDALLSAEAGERGFTYVSALDWDLPFGADDVHLTTAGHGAYAERIRDVLVQAGAL